MKQGQYQGYEHIKAQGKPMYYPFNYPVHPSYLPMNNLHLLHNVAQLELPFAPPTAGQYQPHNALPQEYRHARQPMYPGQPVGCSGGVLKDREISCPVAGCSFRCDAQDVQTALNHFSAVHPNYPRLSMDFLQKHRLNYYAQDLSAHSGGAHKEDLTQSRPLEDHVPALNRNETAVPGTVARSGYESPASDYEPSNDEDYMPSEKKGRRKLKPRRNASSRRSEDREDVSLVETIVESKAQTEEPQMVCCPIKGCKYKSKVDMNVRIHFTKVHKGLSFPEEFIKKYDLVVCPVPGCNSSASGVGKFHTLKTHIALHHPQLDINHYIKLAQASCSNSTKKDEVTAKTQTVNQQVKSNHSTLNIISKVPDRFGSNINSNFSNFIMKRNDEELDESTEASSRNSSNNSSANISPITVPALIDDDNGEQTKLPNAFYWPKENTDPAAHNMVLKPIKPNDAPVVVLEQTSGLRNTNAILKCPYSNCNHIRTGKKGWYNLRDHWLTVHTDAPLDPFLMKDTEKVAMYCQSEVKVVIPKKKRKTAFLIADNYDQNVETNEECRNDMSDMKKSKIARKSSLGSFQLWVLILLFDQSAIMSSLLLLGSCSTYAPRTIKCPFETCDHSVPFNDRAARLTEHIAQTHDNQRIDAKYAKKHDLLQCPNKLCHFFICKSYKSSHIMALHYRNRHKRSSIPRSLDYNLPSSDSDDSGLDATKRDQISALKRCRSLLNVRECNLRIFRSIVSKQKYHVKSSPSWEPDATIKQLISEKILLTHGAKEYDL